MAPGRPPLAVTVARVQAIDIAVEWRWAPVLVLATWLLAQNVLPAHFPTWQLATNWLTAGAAVLAGEAALLLHELTHALLARSHGLHVRRIVFHGFQAQTVVDDGAALPPDEVLIALAGPATNLVLAGLAQAIRIAGDAQGPLDAFLLMLAMGNAAAAFLSLLPLGASDGARALRAARRTGPLEGQVSGQGQDQYDQDEQPERRPTVVAPAVGAAVAAAE
jgi:Zn-dependent protease